MGCAGVSRILNLKFKQLSPKLNLFCPWISTKKFYITKTGDLPEIYFCSCNHFLHRDLSAQLCFFKKWNMAVWVRKVNQLTGWSSNRLRQVHSGKGVQIRRTQVKKCFPEWSGFASNLFRDSRISATKGINFFPVSKIFSTKRFPGIWSISLGSTGIKGNVLRGGVVLNMIIAETNIGKNLIEIIE